MAPSRALLKSGVPMVTFMVLGSYGLSVLLQGKHELDDSRKGKRSLTVRAYDLEQDYKDTMAKLKLGEGYENVRIPRPEDE